MNLHNRISAFVDLGKFINLLTNNNMQALSQQELRKFTNNTEELEKAQDDLINYFQYSINYNAWFTQEFVLLALNDWANSLQKEKIEEWLSSYHINNQLSEKTVAVVMAGNLPLVGFHDYLSVLLSGHKIQAKLSSDDTVLLPILHRILGVFEPKMIDRAKFTKSLLKNFNAIIATGSNNTSRYFDYYFGKYPNIIRRNRSGVAILSGDETEKELENLSLDIMTYFGLGCRSVSKLYIPKNYNFNKLFTSLESCKHLANHHKFFNNYEYNKAIYLVNSDKHLDTGFLLFKNDTALSSPISVIYFEEYTNHNSLMSVLEVHKDEIQCIIGKDYIPFGMSQHPQLYDYADGVDTLQFLSNL